MTALEWRRHLVARTAAGYPVSESVETYAAGLALLRRIHPVTLLGFWRPQALVRWFEGSPDGPAFRGHHTPGNAIPRYRQDCRPGRRPLAWWGRAVADANDFAAVSRRPNSAGDTVAGGDPGEILVADLKAFHNGMAGLPDLQLAHGWWYPAVAAALGVGLGFDPAWRTEAVVGLARSIVEDDRTELFPVLADALEDAGCHHPDLARLRVSDWSLTPVDWWAWTAAHPVPPEEPVDTHLYGVFWEFNESHDPETERTYAAVVRAVDALAGPGPLEGDWARDRAQRLGLVRGMVYNPDGVQRLVDELRSRR